MILLSLWGRGRNGGEVGGGGGGGGAGASNLPLLCNLVGTVFFFPEEFFDFV